MTQEGIPPPISYRQGLSMTVAAICVECGYDSIQKSALETLTEMLQSYLTETGRSTRQYCEVGGRSLATLCDAQAALADVGFKLSSLPKYIQRQKRVTIGEVTKSVPTQNPNVLLVGERKNFPSHIPESSKYPKFPDPHTYVRTLTGQEPESKYSVLREKGSSQRWDVERALTRFIAKTGSSHPLLPEDKNAFPLISAVASPITYQSALLPCEDENVAKTKCKDSTQDSASDSDVERGDEMDEESSKNDKSRSIEKRKLKHTKMKAVGSNIDSPRKIVEGSKDKSLQNIDNPYLRPAKTPKLKKRPR